MRAGRFSLARIVTVLTEELGLPVAGGARRRSAGAGGAAAWSPTNVSGSPARRRCAGRMQLDPRIDPPPDLAIEVEVSRSAAQPDGDLRGAGRPRSVAVRRAGPYVPRPQHPGSIRGRGRTARASRASRRRTCCPSSRCGAKSRERPDPPVPGLGPPAQGPAAPPTP